LGVTIVAKPPVNVPTPSKRPNVAVTAPRDGGPPGSASVPPAADDPRPAQPAGKMPALPAPVPPAADDARPAQPAGKMPALPGPPAPQPVVRDVATSLADAQRAIDSGDVARARSIYDALSTTPSLSHDAALRVAEGLYRVSDFAAAARAFAGTGSIGRGEEQYHYYYAVTLYETGRYGNAK